MEKIQLSSHFTYKKIIRFCFAPILMMLFTSIYGVVDGFFIANFDSQNAFAGVNLIFPIVSIVGGTGFMFASGGSALVSKLLGEGKREMANKVFTMLVIFSTLLVAALSFVAFAFIDQIVYAVASLSNDSTQEMIDKAILYGKILVLGQPIFSLQAIFQNFFMVDEKPRLGFAFTLASGIANMIFDALFVGVFSWGCAGAAVATILGYVIGGVGPVIYFIKNRSGLIYFVKTHLHWRPIWRTITNGVSDFIFTISSSIVGIFYNAQLLRYIGQAGISANGVLMYMSFVSISIFIGLNIGMGPVISFNYGAQNDTELKNVVKRLFICMAVSSLVLTGIGIALAKPMVMIFCKEEALIELATKAMIIHTLAYFFISMCIATTGMFTALNNGLISGLISLFRCLILQILLVMILPLIFGADGIWYAIISTEVIAFIFCVVLFFANRKKYHY